MSEGRIQRAFSHSKRGVALMPYLLGDFPSSETSLEIGRAYVEAGADLIEVGVPFSDPLADGPVIQAAGTEALAHGAHLDSVLEVASRLAEEVPVVLMCYTNMVIAPGVEVFARNLREAGISGLIVPDLPLEEDSDILRVCDTEGISLVATVSPMTPDERMRAIGKVTRGFLYAISVVGITGEREDLTPSFAEILDRAHAATEVPVALGFGISTPEHVRAATQAGADGIIIGSRLVRAAMESPENPAEAAGEVLREMAAGLSGLPSQVGRWPV